MTEIIGKKLIANKKTVEVDSFNIELTKTYPGVYEVIRIIDGVPLFLEKHLERFHSSAKLLGFEIYESDESISDMLRHLVELNDLRYGNVKIVINNLGSPVQDVYGFFIVSKYPSEEQVENGVPVILYSAERNNPNAKSTDLSFRESITNIITKNNVYEALLVNKNGEITEGSKSNVFFVKDTTIYTPPVETILPGVTRGFVMDICVKLGLRIEECIKNKSFLNEIDGLFLTGTSPQVLPISSVDGFAFKSSSNYIITNIRLSYEKMVQDYIDSHR